MAKNNTNLFDNKKFVLVISLIIAFVIWVSVSPQRDTGINCNIQIDTSSSSAGELGLEVTDGKEQTVSVTVAGKWYKISELSQDDINISYSFAGIINAGEYELQLTATKKNSSDDFTITGISPEKVKVSLDYIKTNDYTIDVVANNISAKKGSVVGTPIIDSDQSVISVTGPEKALSKLNRVVARIKDKKTLSKSTVFETELVFLNSRGKEINTTQLTIPYDKVNVTVPINIYKTVPIKASFTDVPTGFSSSSISYSVSPNKIELLGTAEALENISNVTIGTISYSDITPKNYSFKIKLDLPSGVTSVTGVDYATVKIDMSDFTSKTIKVSKFKSSNNSLGKSVSVKTSYKSVTVVGPKSILDDITSDDLYLVYDLSTIEDKTGTVSVNASIFSSKSTKLWIAGDCQLQIDINE